MIPQTQRSASFATTCGGQRMERTGSACSMRRRGAQDSMQRLQLSMIGCGSSAGVSKAHTAAGALFTCGSAQC